MGVDGFRKATRLLSIACLIEAAACGLVVGDLPEPSSGPLKPGAGGSSGIGAAGGAGNRDGGGSAGQSGSSGQGGALGDGGTSAGGGGDAGSSGVGGAGGAGGSGGASGTAGAAGGTSGSGGSGGAGGNAGSGGASGTGGGSGTGGTAGAGGACDVDRDGVRAESCGGTDCDDGDPNVKPGQLGWFAQGNPNVGFDYDCSDTIEREFTQAVRCDILAGAACTAQSEGFHGLPACGQIGEWGKCQLNLSLLCAKLVLDTRPMRCH